MQVWEMKREIINYYGTGSSFSRRVTKMKDNQIIAIYRRLQNKGVFK